MQVQRTLVKSPPELWTEVSDVESLTRHLAAFGEITITRVVPESTVAWEGEHASGTVELTASGWGTKVTLTATAPEPRASAPTVSEPAPAAEPPEPDPAPAPAPRRRWTRFWRREADAPAAAAAPTTPPPPPAPPEPAPPDPEIRLDDDAAEAALTQVLDDLGQAHKRPFSQS